MIPPPLAPHVVDLFAGPGGWTRGLQLVAPDLVELGIEWEPWACATRRAADLLTRRADVLEVAPEDYAGVSGLIASPPCPLFSNAGTRQGVPLLERLRRYVALALEDGWRPTPATVDELADAIGYDGDDGGVLPGFDSPALLAARATAREALCVVAPAWWAHTLRPGWIALEQVPAVLPVWEEYAEVLGRLGYSTWCGRLNAADYGVPQTRVRAVLIASRVHQVAEPPRTHADPRKGVPERLEPWVTMAEALGWPDVGEVATAATTNGTPERYRRSIDEPSPTLIPNADRWRVNTGRDWPEGGTREDAQTIDCHDHPAPTLTGQSGGQWHLVPGGWGYPEETSRRAYVVDEEPAPTLAFGHDAARWCWERPATTVMGDPRNWPPGHKVNADDVARLGLEEATERYGDRAGSEAIRLTVPQALALQSFPVDWPVAGGSSAAFLQVGNAVPPRLAAHVLAEVLGHPSPVGSPR